MSLSRIEALRSELGPEASKFDDECDLVGVKASTRQSYLEKLRIYISKARELYPSKSLAHFAVDEVKDVLLRVKRNYKPGSYRTIVILTRKFYEVLKRKDIAEELELPRVKNEALPDVLNREDVAKLIKGITDLRDRLIVELLYETGARAHEVAQLKIKDIQFDEHSGIAIFRVSKTESRRLRFFAAVPDMRTWLNNHPNRGDAEAPLWISDKASGRPPGRNMIYHAVRNWGKAVLGRHVKPHMLRHTRFTHLSGTLSDRVLKKLGGWSTTKMLETYSHLSGKDVDQSVLAAHGIKVGEELTKPILELIKCPNCEGENVATAIYCQQCGQPLASPALKELMAQRDREIQELRKEVAELRVFKEDIERQIAPQRKAWREALKAERRGKFTSDTEHNGGKPFESRIISEDELTGYLDEGWDLVKELSNGKIVIRRPIAT